MREQLLDIRVFAHDLARSLTVGKKRRIGDFALVVVRVELDCATTATAVEAVIVGEECLSRTKQDDEAVSAFCVGDTIRRQKSDLCELPQMRAKLVALNDRAVFLHGQPAEPFST